jgi:hypothetical protein
MRALLRAPLLLVTLLCFSELLSCQQKQPQRSEPLVSEKHPALAVTFLYLPDSARTEFIVRGDSCSLKRFDAHDSVLSSHDTVLADSVKALSDSLLALLETVAVGTYAKEQVLDGTRIWIRWRGKEVYCDNCLNDYIRQALGLSAPTVTNQNLEIIKNAVGMINVIIAAVEKGHSVAQRAQSLRELQDLYQKRYRRTIKFADEPSHDSTFTKTSEHQPRP